MIVSFASSFQYLMCKNFVFNSLLAEPQDVILMEIFEI